MNKNSIIKIIFIAVSLYSASLMAGQAEGWFGIDINVDGEGRFWNPVIKSATVNDIAPQSPAAQSRMQKGDKIVSIGGIAIIGARARSISDQLEVGVGERVTFEMEAADGGTYSLTLIAGQRPE